MSLGDAWDTTTPGSASKLNKVTVISGSGTYITGLTKADHILFRANDSTGGLTVDHYYGVSADGTSLIDLSDTNSHTHSSSSTGGKLMDILRSNPDVLDSGQLFTSNVRKSLWVEVVDGTASVADDTDGTTTEHSIKLATGGTNGSSASIKQPGIEMDMSKRSWCKGMIRFGTASSLAFRFGFGADSLNASDADTRKYNAEVCTTVNNNWFIRTATGSARSATDSGTSAMVTTRQSLRLEHYPDLGTPKVDLYIDEGSVFTKTSNIPTTYASDDPAPDDIFRQNLKNNTGSDRTAFLYGVRYAYQTSSDWN